MQTLRRWAGRRLWVVGLGALLIVGAACAQQLLSPEQDEAARLLFRHAWLRSEMLSVSVDQGMAAAGSHIDELFKLIEKRGGPVSSREREAVTRAVRKAFEEMMLSREFEDAAVRIYASRFSVQELREIYDWNRTPLGEKVLRATPAMYKEFTEVGSRLGGSDSMKQRLIRDLRAALPNRKLE